MMASGVHPDHNVFPSVLKSSTLLVDLRFGESVHACIVRLGFYLDLYTNNALMNMYAKFQSLDMSSRDEFYGLELSGGHKIYVHEVLDRIPERNGDGQSKSVLVSCNEPNTDYRRRLQMDSVRKVFEQMPTRDLVSWNTVIVGFARSGLFEEALKMVREMGNNANLKPDSFTLSSVLPIFAEYVDVIKGKAIHGYAIRHGLDTDLFIGSSLIDMYAKCTRLEDSHRVFGLLPRRDGITWNSIIAGCVQNGMFDEGLKFFRQMLLAKIKPRHVSFSSIMPACAHMTTLHLGKQLHGYIIRNGYDDNVFIASSLVDMYAKCGNIRLARCIFDKMELHDMVSWTSIIMGHALHGYALDAISLFEQMEKEGVKANSIAFVAALTACSHAGLIDKAWSYFNSMTQDYGIVPGLEHYTAMADLLGRAGKLEEAYEFISSMHIRQPTGSIWSTLLSACRVHKNVELAEKLLVDGKTRAKSKAQNNLLKYLEKKETEYMHLQMQKMVGADDFEPLTMIGKGVFREMLSSKDINFVGYTFKNFEIVNDHQLLGIETETASLRLTTPPPPPSAPAYFSGILYRHLSPSRGRKCFRLVVCHPKEKMIESHFRM
ncbi:hypothetical protein Q3G72_003039 [Acer saccharum]|nr:hypothetical protein Q3G72_003039 [Acer saccharum]